MHVLRNVAVIRHWANCWLRFSLSLPLSFATFFFSFRSVFVALPIGRIISMPFKRYHFGICEYTQSISLENWNGRMRFIVIMRLFELFPLNILISKNRMYRMSKMCYFLMDLIFVAVVQLGAFTISWKLEFGQNKPTKSPYQELNILCVRKCVSHISDQAFAIVRAVNEDLNFIGSYHWFLWLSSKLTEYHSVHPIFFSSPKKFIILWKYQIFHEIIFIGWWSKLFV